MMGKMMGVLMMLLLAIKLANLNKRKQNNREVDMGFIDMELLGKKRRE